METVKEQGKHPRNGFFIYDNSSYKRVLFDDIVALHAEGSYTKIMLLNSSDIILTSINIGRLESMLNDDRFVRVHRSYIINLEKIVEIEREEGLIRLEGNNAAYCARSRKDELLERLNVIQR